MSANGVSKPRLTFNDFRRMLATVAPNAEKLTALIYLHQYNLIKNDEVAIQNLYRRFKIIQLGQSNSPTGVHPAAPSSGIPVIARVESRSASVAPVTSLLPNITASSLPIRSISPVFSAESRPQDPVKVVPSYYQRPELRVPPMQDPYDFNSVAAMASPVQPYHAISSKQSPRKDKPMPLGLGAKRNRPKTPTKSGQNMIVIAENGKKLQQGFYEKHKTLCKQTRARASRGGPCALLVAECVNHKWSPCVDFRKSREPDLFAVLPTSGHGGSELAEVTEVNAYGAVGTLFPSFAEYQKTRPSVKKRTRTYSSEYAISPLSVVDDCSSDADPDVRAELSSMLSSEAVVALASMVQADSANAKGGSSGTVKNDAKSKLNSLIPPDVKPTLPPKEPCTLVGVTGGDVSFPECSGKNEAAKPLDIGSEINGLENEVFEVCCVAGPDAALTPPAKRKLEEHVLPSSASVIKYARSTPPESNNNNTVNPATQTGATGIQPTTSNSGSIDSESDAPSCSSSSINGSHVPTPTTESKNDKKVKQCLTQTRETGKQSLSILNGHSTSSGTADDYYDDAYSNLTDAELLERARVELSSDDDVGSQFVDLGLKTLNLAVKLRRNLDELRRFGMF